MTDKLLIDRELLERIPLDLLIKYGYNQTAAKIEKLLAADHAAHDLDMVGQQPEPQGEIVTVYDPDSRSYEEHEVGPITIVQHLDTKGSRKALGAMNAKLRCKVGHLERKIAEQCQELEILHKQLDRFRDQAHGIPALAEHERLREQIAAERQRAEGAVEALRDIADDYSERFDMSSPSTNPGMKIVVENAREALAAWDVKP